MSSRPKQWHAWFSAKAVAAGCGTSIYRSSKNGKDVEITCVHPADDPYVPERGMYAWPDAEYRGLVDAYVRSGRRSDDHDYLHFIADEVPYDDDDRMS